MPIFSLILRSARALAVGVALPLFDMCECVCGAYDVCDDVCDVCDVIDV